MSDLQVYDTTLRDGAQQEGLNLSVSDKLAIAAQLDDLGVGFIEGGWPGANPKDTEFFAVAQRELTLCNATLAAFGATRRPGGVAADDVLVRALLESGAPVVTLVAKSHAGHVEKALRTTLAENLAMVRDTVSFLHSEGRRVFLDAEHFFDGYLLDRAYALEVLRAAAEAGAEVVALCDTNGGMLPPQVADVVADVLASTQTRLGIHCHNDTGCAVANSLAAVAAGATQVQGTINGYGERTGNADLLTVVSNLELKLGMEVLPQGRLREATRIAHAISEVTNVPPYSRQPYVGASAFAHKAGLHASALKVDPDLYQHTDPTAVGNDMRMLVSDMAGRASIELKGRELGYDLSGQGELLSAVVAKVKGLELQGYTFDAADASFELLLREAVEGAPLRYFDVESWRVITDSSTTDSSTTASSTTDSSTTASSTTASSTTASSITASSITASSTTASSITASSITASSITASSTTAPSDGDRLGGGSSHVHPAALSEATVKLVAGGTRVLAAGEGNGPVNALDHALRQALAGAYPEIEKLELIDFRVRILDSAHGTDAVTRVLIETSDGTTSWQTVGVAPNIVEASWEALVDALTYGLLRQSVPVR